MSNYQVKGKGPFDVIQKIGKRGAIVYDFIASRGEADCICAILNEGIGPEWDAVEPELERRLAEVAHV